MDGREIAAILDQLATDIQNAPIELVGVSVNVRGGGGGSVTGLAIHVEAGPAGTSSTGMRVRVDANEYEQKASQLITELRSASNEARSGSPSRGWIKSLIEKAQGLGNRALNKSIDAAVAALAAYLSAR
ncbi:hypothetical protein [Brucella anthropi]|uniref:hypothetical protein n=1 Tax=Brucella anthropi TaxID=529 RepID=UPI0032088E26